MFFMKGIGKIFDTKYGGLIFSLAAGCAYFIIILNIVLQSAPRAGLLGFFFAPAIIAGTGLVLLKTIKRLIDEEQPGRVNALCWVHIVLMALSLVFLADLIF